MIFMLFCVLKVCEKLKNTPKMLDDALLRVKKALVVIFTSNESR
jgi:hypothetical protein